MLTFSLIIQIVSGALLSLLILVHSPKGDGMASIGGASQLFSSQKGAEAGLNKVTTVCAAIFILTSILLGFHIIK
ncbi:MAG: preprotein translocase subunit SecG [Candidatus Gastranaerophilales bacterium]|nr:preprotein translocase subunit SecG [Candidatus Gastranaerophilales bacterium]